MCSQTCCQLHFINDYMCSLKTEPTHLEMKGTAGLLALGDLRICANRSGTCDCFLSLFLVRFWSVGWSTPQELSTSTRTAHLHFPLSSGQERVEASSSQPSLPSSLPTRGRRETRIARSNACNSRWITQSPGQRWSARKVS